MSPNNSTHLIPTPEPVTAGTGPAPQPNTPPVQTGLRVDIHIAIEAERIDITAAKQMGPVLALAQRHWRRVKRGQWSTRDPDWTEHDDILGFEVIDYLVGIEFPSRIAEMLPLSPTIGGAGDDHRPAHYLSGPMSGLQYDNVPVFVAASERLRAAGVRVVSPVEAAADQSGWHACMRADIKALCDCDVLVLLPGWENSNGAHLELHIAHRLGLRVTTLNSLIEEIASMTGPQRPS